MARRCESWHGAAAQGKDSLSWWRDANVMVWQRKAGNGLVGFGKVFSRNDRCNSATILNPATSSAGQ